MSKPWTYLLILLLMVVQTTSMAEDLLVLHSADPARDVTRVHTDEAPSPIPKASVETALVKTALVKIVSTDVAQASADSSQQDDSQTFSPHCHTCHCHGSHLPLTGQAAALGNPAQARFQTDYQACHADGYLTPILRPPIA